MNPTSAEVLAPPPQPPQPPHPSRIPLPTTSPLQLPAQPRRLAPVPLPVVLLPSSRWGGILAQPRTVRSLLLARAPPVDQLLAQPPISMAAWPFLQVAFSLPQPRVPPCAMPPPTTAVPTLLPQDASKLLIAGIIAEVVSSDASLKPATLPRLCGTRDSGENSGLSLLAKDVLTCTSGNCDTTSPHFDSPSG